MQNEQPVTLVNALPSRGDASESSRGAHASDKLHRHGSHRRRGLGISTTYLGKLIPFGVAKSGNALTIVAEEK